ncbi:DUF2934 domain-containing protein [Archangium violaceum]|uniref:DUF2934 domain-containing protein n=1 Tax=Archangium violaceum TaxID=83451 RepID=UPI00194FD45C|nr:DUF2934 domain-containing protein [Archangium violaceum]QRN94858.1 DUF2934 domain-containing protein [Archangium violaceum]
MARTQSKTNPPSSQQTPESSPRNGAASRNTPTSEQIARRAYELFLSRGGQHGFHEQDWSQAERELRLGR